MIWKDRIRLQACEPTYVLRFAFYFCRRSVPTPLSGGVMVAQGSLEPFVMVRIHAGQPQLLRFLAQAVFIRYHSTTENGALNGALPPAPTRKVPFRFCRTLRASAAIRRLCRACPRLR